MTGGKGGSTKYTGGAGRGPRDMSEPDGEPAGTGGPGGQELWRPALLVAFVVVALVAARAVGLGDRLAGLRGWIGSLGAWGPVVFLLIYIVAVVAALPGSAMTVLAGALFGSVTGVALVSVGSTVGASLAFLIARYFARGSVAAWLSDKEKFRRLDELAGERGAVIVALTRLVPVFPFNLLNYGFGLTRVPFWTYVFWSWLCMLPGTVLYVVGADAATKAFTEGRAPWGLIGAALASAVALGLLVRYARGRLRETEKK